MARITEWAQSRTARYVHASRENVRTGTYCQRKAAAPLACDESGTAVE
jgi:hypothetical protein